MYSALVVLLVFSAAYAEIRLHESFFRGRPKEGFVPRPPQEAVDSAAKNSNVTVGWFTQKLDHFSPNQATWKQQYMTNKGYYRAGGPIFVMIGGEGAISLGWMTYGDWVKNGKIYGAYLLQLEHRYYGKSLPTPDASTGNLRWLSSEQALADLSNFITWMKNKLMMQNAKVVVFGGSYPGNLAAWFRLKYPQVTNGAVASSAPVWAKADFFEYLEVVGTSLDYVQAGCSNYVQQAFNTLTTSITSGNAAPLTKMFNLCTPVDPTQTMNVATLYESLIGGFQGAVQYNKMGPRSQVAYICQVMSSSQYGSDPLHRLGYLYNPSGKLNKTTCLGYNYQDEINWLKQTSWTANAAHSGTRSWIYQTCTEFGYYQTTDSKKQPFGTHMSLKFVEQLCKDVFGISAQTVSAAIQQTNNIYGARNLVATNVVLPNGSIDPWHALGILKSLGPTETAQYYMGGSHCYDMMNPNQYDTQALKMVRLAITSQISRFLA